MAGRTAVASGQVAAQMWQAQNGAVVEWGPSIAMLNHDFVDTYAPSTARSTLACSRGHDSFLYSWLPLARRPSVHSLRRGTHSLAQAYSRTRSFRTAHPDPTVSRGFTWTPGLDGEKGNLPIGARPSLCCIAAPWAS